MTVPYDSERAAGLLAGSCSVRSVQLGVYGARAGGRLGPRRRGILVGGAEPGVREQVVRGLSRDRTRGAQRGLTNASNHCTDVPITN